MSRSTTRFHSISHSEAGDFVTVSLYKTGSTDAEDIIVEDRRAIDATTVQVDETPTAGDTLVRVTATTSDDDLEAFDDDLEIRVGDADGTELTEAPVSVNVLRITDISLTRSLTAGEELTVVAQPPGEYDPNAEFATTTTVDQPNESVVEISERPDTGAESLTIEGFVDDDDGEVDARVRLGAEADIAVDAPTLQPGGSFDESISLDQPLEAGDLPILNLYKTGSTDEEDIVASFGISVDATTVEIDQPVTDGDNAIWLTATASDELLADQDPVVRVADADGTDLTTEPETVGAAWGGEFELTKSVTAGDELTVVVQPPGEYDPDAAFASATTTVGESLDLEPAFTFEPESPDVETEVSFDASPTEPSSDVATYSWGFTGNEEIDSEGQEVTHTHSRRQVNTRWCSSHSSRLTATHTSRPPPRPSMFEKAVSSRQPPVARPITRRWRRCVRSGIRLSRATRSVSCRPRVLRDEPADRGLDRSKPSTSKDGPSHNRSSRCTGRVGVGSEQSELPNRDCSRLTSFAP